MEWSDTGLVLAKGVFREYDVWLKMLFREHGVLTVFAFGGLHSRRRFVGCLDLLNLLECRVREGRRGFLNLTEAVLVRGPHVVRRHPGLQGLAMNFLKLVESAGIPQDTAGDVLRLMDESLVIMNRESVPRTLSLFFRLKLAALLGYAPDFLHCSLCRRALTERSFFCVEEGGVLCSGCLAGYRGRRSGALLSLTSLKLLQMVAQSFPFDWKAHAAGESAGDWKPGSPVQAEALGNPAAGHGRPEPWPRLDGGELKSARLCVDGILSCHMGLVWERGRYVRM